MENRVRGGEGRILADNSLNNTDLSIKKPISLIFPLENLNPDE
jgi:hypothetical protein